MVKVPLHSAGDASRLGFGAPRLHTRTMNPRRALPVVRLTSLGATLTFTTGA